jgi:small GTP-binding protein
MQRIITGEFSSNTTATVGVGVREISWKSDGTEQKIHLWDTAGQEKYRSIVPIYFRNANLALLFVGMDNKGSFDRLDGWLDLLRENTEHSLPVVVVGSKIDLDPELDRETVKNWAGKSGEYRTFFTSAFDGTGVAELFDYIASNAAREKERAIAKEVVRKNEQNCC